MTVAEQVLKTVRRYGMLSPGDSVVVGVSGGADSVSLLCLLCELRETLSLYEIEVCHLHHGLRGEEAERDLAFVRALCGRMGVPFRERREDVARLAAESGTSEENAGRAARYRFFEETADLLAARRSVSPGRVRIATAHTAGDNAETVLMNLVRGSAMSGLCGIPPVRGRIVRPLIECARPELESYLAGRGETFVNDGSNFGDDYRRNRLRHSVLPLLRAENPALDTALFRMTETIRLEDSFLAAETDKLLIRARRSVRPPSYDRAVLADAHDALLNRAAACLLEQSGAAVDTRKTLALSDAVRSGSGGVTVAPGVCWRVRPAVVFLETAFDRPEPVPFEPGVSYPFGAGRLYGNTLNGKTDSLKIIHENPLINTIDCAKIVGTLVLRPRAPGDTLEPVGRGCRKSLKKLFSETRLLEREQIPVLADDLGAVWVGGFGADERVRPDSGSVRLLEVCYAVK